MAILDDVRKAMFIADDDHEFDTTITDLIASAMLDLGIAGANGENVVVSNPLVKTAIVTYCKMHFGQSDEYDRLKKSYDEQKAQMATATGYTIWSGCNG